MLYFKKKNAIIQQKKNYIKEVYYKLYKLFIIFLKWNKFLGKLLVQNKTGLYYHNLCVITNKTKNVSRKLKISRIMIREISNKGFFFGLNKSSW
jgi:ribosomal protein S14